MLFCYAMVSNPDEFFDENLEQSELGWACQLRVESVESTEPGEILDILGQSTRHGSVHLHCGHTWLKVPKLCLLYSLCH